MFVASIYIQQLLLPCSVLSFEFSLFYFEILSTVTMDINLWNEISRHVFKPKKKEMSIAIIVNKGCLNVQILADGQSSVSDQLFIIIPN